MQLFVGKKLDESVAFIAIVECGSFIRQERRMPEPSVPTSMRSKPVAALLIDLEVAKTHSRPHEIDKRRL